MKVLLSYYQCPGDTLVSTAAVESLGQQYPNKYALAVEGTATREIFEHNPHVKGYQDPPDLKIRMENPLVNSCNQRPVHFMDSYCELLAEALGICLPLSVKRPYLYIGEAERKWINQVEEAVGYKGRFWLVCSGTKNDYTVKGWGQWNYQAVVDQLRGRVQFVQVGAKDHDHPVLEGALDLRGKTDHRQLIRLAYHAQGGLGGVSYLHHIFAGLARPFVCVASGMEPITWEAYPTDAYLSRHGRLPCCQGAACWKSRVVKLNDKSDKDNSLCVAPVVTAGGVLPHCMEMIKAEEVTEAILSFYRGGVLFGPNTLS
jgi:ADP-heptose:LPS heptosyltransferase